MKTITVGELRQNPTAMLADVERGATYVVTRHHRQIAQIGPTTGQMSVVPPKRRGGASTSTLPRRDLQSAASIEELLDAVKGDW